MPRLDTFTLKIKTGECGLPNVPKYSINGFQLDFDEVRGGAGSDETLEVTGNPQSFPHTLVLSGPEEGRWDIEGIDATYHCAAEEPYTIRLGAVKLDERQDLNVWYERPVEVIEV